MCTCRTSCVLSNDLPFVSWHSHSLPCRLSDPIPDQQAEGEEGKACQQSVPPEPHCRVFHGFTLRSRNALLCLGISKGRSSRHASEQIPLTHSYHVRIYPYLHRPMLRIDSCDDAAATKSRQVTMGVVTVPGAGSRECERDQKTERPRRESRRGLWIGT